MSTLQAFNPVWGSAKQLVGAAGEVVQAYALAPVGASPPQLLMTNDGTVNVRVRVSPVTDTRAAGVGDMLILANTQVVVTVNLFEPFNVRLAAGATGSTLDVIQGSGF